jgi:hypothetical protein
MIRLRGYLLAAAITATSGCGPSVPLAPPPAFNPVAMQVAPGLGFSLQGSSAVYLVMNAVDARDRIILPRLAEVVAAELRTATPAEIIVLVDAGLDCPPTAEWSDLCQACDVPVRGAPPSAVVVFCDLLEYDPYTPLRVGLSMRVRRATDGVQLTGLQGTWAGAPPITPTLPPFHWFRKKGPPRPNVEFAWTAQYEDQSATQLVRHAARQCVATLSSSGGGVQQAAWPTASSPQFEELMPPPAPPALPEIVPPPAPEIIESAPSIPEESHPSP